MQGNRHNLHDRRLIGAILARVPGRTGLSRTTSLRLSSDPYYLPGVAEGLYMTVHLDLLADSLGEIPEIELAGAYKTGEYMPLGSQTMVIGRCHLQPPSVNEQAYICEPCHRCERLMYRFRPLTYNAAPYIEYPGTRPNSKGTPQAASPPFHMTHAARNYSYGRVEVTSISQSTWILDSSFWGTLGALSFRPATHCVLTDGFGALRL